MAAISLAGLVAIAGAQQIAGQWHCELTARDATHQILSQYSRFTMFLQPDGGFTGQGIARGGGLEYPIEIWGRWELDASSTLQLVGQQTGPFNPIPFGMVTQPTSAGTLAMTWTLGATTHASQCQR